MSFVIERYFQILENHQIYSQINSIQNLAFFAERHVVCVWSYNALLRSLQRDLIAQSMPLNSEPHKIAVRLITELILSEEVSDLGDGSFQSHLELYLEAMRDVNCDISQMFTFFDLLAQEKDMEEILEQSNFAPEVEKYARVTMALLEMPIHRRAAALFYEGEPFIPDRFLINLWGLKHNPAVEKFVHYFERHIEGIKCDGYSQTGRLVEVLCSFDENLRRETDKIAEITMKNRIELWGSILDGIEGLPQVADSDKSRQRFLKVVR